jgi:hypothetical protein
MHQLDRSLDIARVERAVGGPEDQLGLRHAVNVPRGDASEPGSPTVIVVIAG